MALAACGRPAALLHMWQRLGSTSFAFSFFLVKVFSFEDVSTVVKALKNILGMETCLLFPCPFTTALSASPISLGNDAFWYFLFQGWCLFRLQQRVLSWLAGGINVAMTVWVEIWKSHCKLQNNRQEKQQAKMPTQSQVALKATSLWLGL